MYLEIHKAWSWKDESSVSNSASYSLGQRSGLSGVEEMARDCVVEVESRSSVGPRRF